ncbi:MAG: hypothetical protein H0T91_04480, partial [Propionibacteriaceae bacterium]|nr:hypothetical protein [Propionibacteriaceae bacterium]
MGIIESPGVVNSATAEQFSSGHQLDLSTLQMLVDGHWYDALAVLLERSLPAVGASPQLLRVRALATAARRVLDLDAEDFSSIARDFSAPWIPRLAACSFPQQPRDPQRGALGSLVPLYQLMLEVLELRALRRESLQIVVTAHLISEYLVQLAWESTLGHGGDPEQLETFVAGSRWGTDDRLCPHSPAQRSTAKRLLSACKGDLAGYTAYLDRFHSRQGEALAVCAMNHATIGPGERPDVGVTCPNPCGFITELPMPDRRDLDARVRLALLFSESPIVALRHHAPVGHFFGVPSAQEIAAAWAMTWDKVSLPWPDGDNPLQSVDHMSVGA